MVKKAVKNKTGLKILQTSVFFPFCTLFRNLKFPPMFLELQMRFISFRDNKWLDAICDALILL